MKIEKNRSHAGFISHNGLTIFTDRAFLKPDNKEVYLLRVHKRQDSLHEPTWISIGFMELTPDQFEDWLTLLHELKR